MSESDQLPPLTASAPSEKQPAMTLLALGDAGAAAPSAWCALDSRGLLRVEGQDAESFLQGQLTQDMARVRAGAVLLAAHCTPKGRISTLFRCWHDERGFLLDCPASMQAAAQRRLGMYRLRAAAQISVVADEYSRIGISGQALAARLGKAGVILPSEPGTTALTETPLQGSEASGSGPGNSEPGGPEPGGPDPGGSARVGTLRCTALTGERWLILCDRETGARLQRVLAMGCAADEHAWKLASLLAGEPEVLPATSEQFIPQMLNLDLLDGVSFRKGCYTGQEIVARTHYLGRVKRRMQCFRYRADAPPDTTTPLELTMLDDIVDDAGAATQPITAQLVIALQDGPHDGVVLAVLAASTTGTSESGTARPPLS